MERYRVQPDKKFKMEDISPDDKSGFDSTKEEAKIKLLELNEELETLQELLYAEGKHKLLVVLQGMDAAGKDGTIRHVFEGVNPQGVSVTGFKVPTDEELAHDYLWRIHKATPRRGQIMIFNRSHYEDVLVVRVKNLVPPEVWKKRYAQINAFERLLTEEGTTILKFFLHISPEEQKERFQARLDDPSKHWKFNTGDLKDRALWGKYQKAYQDVLNRTSTKWAPWYVIPANRKWYRNLTIACIMIDTLKNLKMKYPKNKEDLSGIVIK
ncbi:MAG: polyphosphate kinase 2 family protein [Anaerolineaceae bacterium]|nr:polyphosphate kinase 2 family protein [Anaerolineaceae bacterium]